MTDKIQNKEVEIKDCPTDDMIGDYNTKPLQGSKFVKFKKYIMNGENELGIRIICETKQNKSRYISCPAGVCWIMNWLKGLKSLKSEQLVENS